MGGLTKGVVSHAVFMGGLGVSHAGGSLFGGLPLGGCLLGAWGISPGGVLPWRGDVLWEGGSNIEVLSHRISIGGRNVSHGGVVFPWGGVFREVVYPMGGGVFHRGGLHGKVSPMRASPMGGGVFSVGGGVSHAEVFSMGGSPIGGCFPWGGMFSGGGGSVSLGHLHRALHGGGKG